LNRILVTRSMLFNFLLVGITTVGTYLLVMTALHELFGINVYLSSTGGFLVGVTASFLLNRNYTFKRAANVTAYFKYVCVLAGAMLLNLLIIYLTVARYGANYMVGQLLSILIITPLNFLLIYTWVFNLR
jgi:putative flippase GtrA